MKKFLKIFIINILISILLIFFLEILSLLIVYINDYRNDDSYKNENHNIAFHITNLKIRIINSVYPNNDYFSMNELREPAGLEYYKNRPINEKNKFPILLLGCSYTYGRWLKDSETFQGILSLNSKRTVYNFGMEGASPREMLYILKNNELRNKLLQNNNQIEYVIYTYIIDHRVRRLFQNTRPKVPHYKKVKNNKELTQCNILYYSYIGEILNDFNIKYSKSYNNKSINLFTLYIKAINKEIKKNFSYGGGGEKTCKVCNISL